LDLSLLFAKRTNTSTKVRSTLVGVREAAHARHDAEHVVVRRVDVHVGRRLLGEAAAVLVRAARGVVRRRGEAVDIRVERRRRERQVQHGIVDTREVARAAGLEVLRLEGKRVDVDARGRRVRVVLVRLHEVEVAALTLRETVLAVELDLGDRDGVAEVRVRVAPRGVELHVAVVVARVLDNPDKLLARVVEGELDLVGGGRNRLRASELELLDEVLVGDLGEAAALLRVEVDIVHVERAGDQALVGNGLEHLLGRGATRRGHVDVAQVLEVLELDVDLNLVVLESDERQREARVAVEPELQRDVQGLLRDAVGRAVRRRVARDNRVRTQRAVVAEVRERGVEAGKAGGRVRVDLRRAGAARARHVDDGAAIAVHHVQVAELLARGERQLIPHVQPLTVVLVDLLAANLNIHIVDHVLAQVGHPRELDLRVVHEHRRVDLGQGHLHIHAGDQILDRGAVLREHGNPQGTGRRVGVADEGGQPVAQRRKSALEDSHARRNVLVLVQKEGETRGKLELRYVEVNERRPGVSRRGWGRR